jgi:hypothetical protein
VIGDVHGVGGALSREHLNVTPDFVSVNLNVADVSAVELAGFAAIDGAGGAVVLTEKTRICATARTLPSVSVADTSTA